MVDIKDLKEQVLFGDLTEEEIRKIAIVAGHNVRRMNENLMNVLVSY